MPTPSLNRLPIDHAEYRYPPSRNPYWGKCRELEGRAFTDNETELRRGLWREAFEDASSHSKNRILHVEIGCNAGHVAVEMAKLHPKDAWIGIDWKFKPIFRAAEKGIKRELQNMLFLRAHAERLPFMFGPGEIDHLYLFFPDPWPRKKQWKNRFITAERLRRIHSTLKSGTGIFHIRTDHLGYFEWMEAAVAEVPELFEIVSRTNDRHASVADPLKLEIPEVTLFEKLWIRDGIKINAMDLRAK